MSHSTEDWQKFDSNDSNERFWQKFPNVKIRKTKIWGLEELEILFTVVEDRILNIHKIKSKLISNIISIWLNSIPVLISTY